MYIVATVRILGRRPCHDLTVFVLGHSCRRLQRRMRQKRHVIRSLVDLAGAREYGVDVADVAHHFLRFLGGLEQRLLVGLRIVARVLARVPRDLQLLATLHRRPDVVGNHRHAAQCLEGIRRFGWGDHHRLLHAAHLPRGLVVVRFQRAAEDRGARD
jgi:hypothetical protein